MSIINVSKVSYLKCYSRYIMAEQKKAEEFGITEDDVSEIRQDINKFRNPEIVFKFNILLK